MLCVDCKDVWGDTTHVLDTLDYPLTAGAADIRVFFFY